MKSFPKTIKGIAFFTLAIFTFGSFGWAQPSVSAPAFSEEFRLPSRIDIPQTLGVLQSSGLPADSNKPLILFIQDAHAVTSAQESIQKLIAHFQSVYPVETVLLEGLSGTMDPTLLRAFPDTFLREKMMRDYFDRGEMTGPEMAAVLNPRQTAYEGLEDRGLYEENARAYFSAVSRKPLFLAEIRSREKALESERSAVYSPRQEKLHAQIERFNSEPSYFPEFIHFLLNFREEARQYPHVSALLESSAGENPESKRAAEIQVAKMAESFRVKQLGRLSPEDQTVFQRKFQAFRTRELESVFFLQTLIRLGEPLGIKPNLTPELQALLKQTEGLCTIQGGALLEELEAFVRELENQGAQTPESKRVLEKIRDLRLLKKLAALELTRKQWEELSQKQASLLTLNLWKPAIHFYELALKRDDTFHQKLEAAVLKRHPKVMIVVAGGFHSQGFESFFKTNHYPYASMTPGMSSLAGQENYEALMRGNVSWRSEVKTSLYDGFMRHAANRLAAALNPLERPAQMKIWHDEILRALAQQERITAAGDYMKYLGTETAAAPKTPGEIEKAVHEVIQSYKARTLDSVWKKFESQFTEFSAGFEKLSQSKKLNAQTLDRLLHSAAKPAMLSLSLEKFDPSYTGGFLLDAARRAENRDEADFIFREEFLDFLSGENQADLPAGDFAHLGSVGQRLRRSVQFMMDHYRHYHYTSEGEMWADLLRILWTKKDTFDEHLSGELPVNSYVETTLKHALIDIYRRQQRRAKLMARGNAESDSVLDDLLEDPHELRPDESAIAAESGVYLEKALTHLEPEAVQIIRAHFWDRLSYAQIAQSLGVSVGTIRHRMSKAMENLKHWLPHHDWTEEEPIAPKVIQEDELALNNAILHLKWISGGKRDIEKTLRIQRVMFLYRDGWKYTAIAEETSAPLGTVKRIVNHAKKILIAENPRLEATLENIRTKNNGQIQHREESAPETTNGTGSASPAAADESHSEMRTAEIRNGQLLRLGNLEHMRNLFSVFQSEKGAYLYDSFRIDRYTRFIPQIDQKTGRELLAPMPGTLKKVPDRIFVYDPVWELLEKKPLDAIFPEHEKYRDLLTKPQEELKPPFEKQAESFQLLLQGLIKPFLEQLGLSDRLDDVHLSFEKDRDADGYPLFYLHFKLLGLGPELKNEDFSLVQERDREAFQKAFEFWYPYIFVHNYINLSAINARAQRDEALGYKYPAQRRLSLYAAALERVGLASHVIFQTYEALTVSDVADAVSVFFGHAAQDLQDAFPEYAPDFEPIAEHLKALKLLQDYAGPVVRILTSKYRGEIRRGLGRNKGARKGKTETAYLNLGSAVQASLDRKMRNPWSPEKFRRYKFIFSPEGIYPVTGNKTKAEDFDPATETHRVVETQTWASLVPRAFFPDGSQAYEGWKASTDKMLADPQMKFKNAPMVERFESDAVSIGTSCSECVSLFIFDPETHETLAGHSYGYDLRLLNKLITYAQSRFKRAQFFVGGGRIGDRASQDLNRFLKNREKLIRRIRRPTLSRRYELITFFPQYTNTDTEAVFYPMTGTLSLEEIRSPSASIQRIETYLKELAKKRAETRGNKIWEAAREPANPRVTVYGGGDDEGPGSSSFLLEIGNTKVLLDGGSGSRERIQANPPEHLDAILLSHAHNDHSGDLPWISALFPDTPVYSSESTADSALLMMEDSASFREPHEKIPYQKNTKALRKRFNYLDPKVWVQLTPELKVRFQPASHIQGANLVYIATPTRNYLYTGDFSGDALRGASPLELLEDFPVDELWEESTYGGTPTPKSREERERDFAADLASVLQAGGKVLIPTFAIGRTTDAALTIAHFQNEGIIPKAPIFVDGQAAIHLESYMRQLADSTLAEDQKLYGLLESSVEFVGEETRSEIMNGSQKGPFMILGGSGSLAGGRSLQYLPVIARDPRNAVILVGHQFPNTVGRELKEGKREFGEGKRKYTVAATVWIHDLGAHARQDALVDLAVKTKPRFTFLIHGELAAKETLKRLLQREGLTVSIPRTGEAVSASAEQEDLLDERRAYFNQLPAVTVSDLHKEKVIRRVIYESLPEAEQEEVIGALLVALNLKSHDAAGHQVIHQLVEKQKESGEEHPLTKVIEQTRERLKTEMDKVSRKEKNAVRNRIWRELRKKSGVLGAADALAPVPPSSRPHPPKKDPALVIAERRQRTLEEFSGNITAAFQAEENGAVPEKERVRDVVAAFLDQREVTINGRTFKIRKEDGGLISGNVAGVIQEYLGAQGVPQQARWRNAWAGLDRDFGNRTENRFWEEDEPPFPLNVDTSPRLSADLLLQKGIDPEDFTVLMYPAAGNYDADMLAIFKMKNFPNLREYHLNSLSYDAKYGGAKAGEMVRRGILKELKNPEDVNVFLNEEDYFSERMQFSIQSPGKRILLHKWVGENDKYGSRPELYTHTLLKGFVRPGDLIFVVPRGGGAALNPFKWSKKVLDEPIRLQGMDGFGSKDERWIIYEVTEADVENAREMAKKERTEFRESSGSVLPLMLPSPEVILRRGNSDSLKQDARNRLQDLGARFDQLDRETRQGAKSPEVFTRKARAIFGEWTSSINMEGLAQDIVKASKGEPVIADDGDVSSAKAFLARTDLVQKYFPEFFERADAVALESDLLFTLSSDTEEIRTALLGAFQWAGLFYLKKSPLEKPVLDLVKRDGEHFSAFPYEGEKSVRSRALGQGENAPLVWAPENLLNFSGDQAREAQFKEHGFQISGETPALLAAQKLSLKETLLLLKLFSVSGPLREGLPRTGDGFRILTGQGLKTGMEVLSDLWARESEAQQQFSAAA